MYRLPHNPKVKNKPALHREEEMNLMDRVERLDKIKYEISE